jgi:hypothetical protein
MKTRQNKKYKLRGEGDQDGAPSRGGEKTPRGFEILPRGFEIPLCGFEILPRRFDNLPRGFTKSATGIYQIHHADLLNPPVGFGNLAMRIFPKIHGSS